MINEKELLKKVSSKYLSLIHLSFQDNEVIELINISKLLNNKLIQSLIVENFSWRERLLGLFFACSKDVKIFYNPLIQSLQNVKGITIIPTFAVLAICINRGSLYNFSMVKDCNRNSFDGEVGFAMDKMHYYTGLSATNLVRKGPNYGQDFEQHYKFYEKICNYEQ